MNKLLTFSALALTPFVLGGSANAFGGANFNEEQFTEMRAIFTQHSDFESFKAAMEAKREERRAAFENMTDEEKAVMGKERGGRRGGRHYHGFGKNVERSVENITNGIVMTLTSDNADIVTDLQTREDKHPEREGVTKSTENITNGVKVTLTSDDADIVEKLQNRSERKEARGAKRGRGMMNQ